MDLHNTDKNSGNVSKESINSEKNENDSEYVDRVSSHSEDNGLPAANASIGSVSNSNTKMSPLDNAKNPISENVQTGYTSNTKKSVSDREIIDKVVLDTSSTELVPTDASLDSIKNCDTKLHQTTSDSLQNKENLDTDKVSHGFDTGEEPDVADGHCESLASGKSGVNLYESSGEVEIRKRKRNTSERTYPEVSHIKDVGESDSEKISKKAKDFSLFHYLKVEVTRGYLFEEQGEKYIKQREKVYTFMKTPRELEKLMWFGFVLCLDCFLFVFTYLPVRLVSALLQLFGNIVCLRFLKNGVALLEPHHICDLLRGFILIVCCTALDNLDLSILYHIVRGQSVIKLYVIYNMLDIADRLFSSIGQDTLDALFLTAAEPKGKRSIVSVLLHFGLASIYVFLHTVLVLFQAITLNVAINSHNKVLMVVMISNQFVELKGCVFKKFEKNNLFQMSCADIRERFYYVVLVSLVALRNMHELQWNLDHLYELMPSIGLLLCSEVFVDWVKHAFITKFNCISSEVYREYRELLARDATTSRLFEQRACSDHFDLVSRRLGFIPLPLGCLVYRITSQSVKISGAAGLVVLILTYLWLMSLKVLNSIILLGMSCQHVIDKETRDNDTRRQEDSHYMNTRSSPPDQQHFVSDPLDKDTKKQTRPSDTHKVKTLNEIDRYTLCSNRIV